MVVGGPILPLVLRSSGKTPGVLNSEDAAAAAVSALVLAGPLMLANPGREQKSVKNLSTTDRKSVCLLYWQWSTNSQMHLCANMENAPFNARNSGLDSEKVRLCFV